MGDWEHMLEKREHARVSPARSQWQRDVNHAVYFAPGWEDWQHFRLSLKGETTQEKMDRLHWYWNSSDHSMVERLRVYNYLGALLRGGFEEARPMWNAMRSGDI